MLWTGPPIDVCGAAPTNGAMPAHRQHEHPARRGPSAFRHAAWQQFFFPDCPGQWLDACPAGWPGEDRPPSRPDPTEASFASRQPSEVDYATYCPIVPLASRLLGCELRD